MARAEERGRDKAFLFQKPAEDEPGEKAYDVGGVSCGCVLFDIGRELYMVERPEIPVGQFTVELPVEFVRVERFAPRLMKLFEVVALVFRHERRQGEVV